MTKEQAIALAKARRRRAEASAPAQRAPVQPTAVARELAAQPQSARARYTQEMAAKAFGDRPGSGEYLQAGLFGTTPLRPSQLAGNID